MPPKDILENVGTSDFRIYNVSLAKELTIYASVIVSEFYNQYISCKKNNTLQTLPGSKLKWFFYDIETVYQRLGISENEQRAALKLLVSYDLIERRVSGLPAKRCFALKFDNIQEFQKNIKEFEDTIQNLTNDNEEHVQNLSSNNFVIKQNSNDIEFAVNQNSNVTSKNLQEVYNSPGLPREINRIDVKEHFLKKKAPILHNTHEAMYLNTPIHENTYINSEKKKNPRAPAYAHAHEGLADIEKNTTRPSASLFSFSNSNFILHGSHVKLKSEDYTKLCKNHTKELIDVLITEMNDYCAANKPKGYKCYAAALRTWVRRYSENNPTNYYKAKPINPDKPVMAKHPPEAIKQNETPEERKALGGKRINKSLYSLLAFQGRDMEGYILDETI